MSVWAKRIAEIDEAIAAATLAAANGEAGIGRVRIGSTDIEGTTAEDLINKLSKAREQAMRFQVVEQRGQRGGARATGVSEV